MKHVGTDSDLLCAAFIAFVQTEVAFHFSSSTSNYSLAVGKNLMNEKQECLKMTSTVWHISNRSPVLSMSEAIPVDPYRLSFLVLRDAKLAHVIVH